MTWPAVDWPFTLCFLSGWLSGMLTWACLVGLIIEYIRQHRR